MLDQKKQMSIARKLHHYFESLLYIEMIRARRKVPVLEFGDDDMSFHGKIDTPMTKIIRGVKKKVLEKVATIHIGIGFFEAEDEKDLFWQIQFMLGHETQHAKSTTGKDWEAGLMLCLSDICNKLAKDHLGKPKVRINGEKDFDEFFKELADKGVFLNKKALKRAVHYVLNSLEDGRIENIRAKRYPGFLKYRKLFRGKEWLNADLRDDGYPADPNNLSPDQYVGILMSEIHCLATCNVHRKGFLAMYGNSDLYTRVRTFIPYISKAVLSRTCKGCMEQGRIIVNMLIDDIVKSCESKEALDDLLSQLENMLKELTESIENSFSATPNNEEEGDGLPSESVFGQSDLEMEVDEETIEQMKEQMAEDGDDIEDGSSSVKIVPKEGESSDEDSSESSGEEGSDTSESPDKADSSETSKETDGQKESGSTSEPEDGKAKSSQKEVDLSKSESLGHNNYDEEHDDEILPEEELEAAIKSAMEDAMNATSRDMDAAENDAKRQEEVQEASAKMEAVTPKPVNIESINKENGYGDVKLLEATRLYKPTVSLPFELENKGKSLSNKIEEMIKNKKSPDLRAQKSGSIDSSRLHVLIGGDIACCKKRGTYEKTDVCGYILIDNSGSMGNGPGSTRHYACDASAVIEEGFKAHMPLKIAAFDAQSSFNVTHEVIKEFDEVTPSNLCHNFKVQGRGGYGNKDGYSIRVATNQLIERDEKDKILIVLSDGLPSDYPGGYREGCSDVKNAVLDAEKAGINVIGLYMYHYQDEGDFALFKDMYRQHIFVNMDEIEPALVSIMKRLFR